VAAISAKKYKVNEWRRCAVLIIDEISMVPPNFFEKIEYAARKIRGDERFFGGIQLVLIGDFFQLPPVIDRSETSRYEFCFELPCFKENITNIVELTRVFRQEDKEFIDVLSSIRQGKLTDAGKSMLEKRLNAEIDTSDGIEPTRLFPTKSQVDTLNNKKLNELEGDEMTYERKQTMSGMRNKKLAQDILARLDTKCPAPPKLVLKKGAQVLLLTNLDVQAGMVNGSRGVVVEFGDEPDCSPIVRFANGLYQTIKEHKWSESPQGEMWVATQSQLPLRLAYGITIHRAQGMTLDRVEMSLRSVFERGQSYVALSRARNLEGLRLLDFDADLVRAHPKVVEYYATVQKEGPKNKRPK